MGLELRMSRAKGLAGSGREGCRLVVLNGGLWQICRVDKMKG